MKTGTNLKAFHFGWILGIFFASATTAAVATVTAVIVVGFRCYYCDGLLNLRPFPYS